MGPKESAWREFLGEDYQPYRDGALHIISQSGSTPDEEVLHALMGTPPAEPALRAAWSNLFVGIRGRIANIATDDPERHLFRQGVLLRSMMKAFRDHHSAALARHFTELYARDLDGIHAGYASAWTFPDKKTFPGPWTVFHDAQGPIALAKMELRPPLEPSHALRTLQGIRDRKVDLMTIADIIVRSWKPMAKAGWRLLMRDDPHYPVYDALMEHYCGKERIRCAGEKYGALHQDAERVREVFGTDAENDANRHRE